MNKSIFIKKNFVVFLILSSIFSLWVGFRGATNDTQTYYSIFKEIRTYNLLSPTDFYYETGVEIGYGWYSYIISYITDSSYVLFSIFSFLSFFFVYKISDKIQIDYFSVFLLYVSSAYFLMQQFMQMRQGLAIPIALLALIFLIDKSKNNLIKFILLSLVSISLHQTAIAILFFGVIFNFLFSKIEMSLKQYKYFILCVIVFFVFLSKFVFMSLLLSISGRLLAYSNSSYGEEIGIFRLPNIKAFFVFFFIFFLINERVYSNKVFKVFMCLLALSVAFRIGFSDFAILSGRFSTAFSHVEVFLLPFIFYRFGKIVGLIVLFVYVFIQAITVYVYQAPYVLQSYNLPLH